MNFPHNVYVGALVFAAAISALALPLCRRWCLRIGLVDDPGHRKIHDQPVPLAGGIALAAGLLVPAIAGIVAVKSGVFWADASVPFEHGVARRISQLTVILLGALGMLLLGLFDDKYELRPAVKFTGQLVIALAVAVAGVRITLFVENPLFSYAVTVFWILTVTNALNFMDNMNGLCAGLGAIASFCFGLHAAAGGQYLVACLSFLCTGALVGFLPYNFPRASAFLGDAGSHLTGYLLAILAILPHFYTADNPRIWAVFLPLLILAVPLADLVWVVCLRWSMGKPFYEGDTNHLSHRLVRRGVSRTTTVLLIWLLAALFGALSFV